MWKITLRLQHSSKYKERMQHLDLLGLLAAAFAEGVDHILAGFLPFLPLLYEGVEVILC